jgi:hypothetical protein
MGQQIGMELNAAEIGLAGTVIADQQVIQKLQVIVGGVLIQQCPSQFTDAILDGFVVLYSSFVDRVA